MRPITMDMAQWKASVNPRSGKNLIPFSFAGGTTTRLGVSIVDNRDGSITLNGTASSSFSYTLVRGFKFENAGTYTLSADNIQSLPDPCTILFAKNNGQSVANINQNFRTATLTIDESELSNDYTAFIFLNSGTSLSNITIAPMLSHGTIPAAYDESKLHFENCKGGSFSTNPEYALRAVGRTKQAKLSGKNLLSAIGIYTVNELNCEPIYFEEGQAYWLSFKSPPSDKWRFMLFSDSETFGGSATSEYVQGMYSSVEGRLQYGSNISVNRFKINVKKSFICNRVTVWNLSENAIVLEEAQIEIYSSEPTAYEPYCGGIPSPNNAYPQPIQCFKTGSRIRVMDESGVTICGATTIYDLCEDDIWYPGLGFIERHSEIVELDGSENWIKYASSDTSKDRKNTFALRFEHSKIGASLSKCTHFNNVVSAWSAKQNAPDFSYSDHHSNNYKYFVCNKTIETVEDLKAFLKGESDAGTPVKICYKLAEPKIIECPTVPLFTKKGTVDVIQEPIELKSELSAMMLVRR